MKVRYPAMIAGALSCLGLPAHAGPCVAEIDQVQALLDARMAATIDSARFAREARQAFGLPPQDGGSLASAERRLHDATWMGDAVVALARAREADRIGDRAACDQALGDLRAAIGR